MKIDGIEYTFLIASDVARNGLSFECYGSKKELLLEVFRDDNKCEFVFSQFVPELPLALIEHVVKVARDELGGFVV